MNEWAGWNAAVWLLVDSLAVYRLTRLIARDTITRPLRRWFQARADPDQYFGLMVRPVGVFTEIIACMWCLSIYFAAVVVGLTWWVPFWWSFGAALLAFSAVAGWLGDKE